MRYIALWMNLQPPCPGCGQALHLCWSAGPDQPLRAWKCSMVTPVADLLTISVALGR